jgi:uncharacterized surface protein with fasciclin (FAS1) repeats
LGAGWFAAVDNYALLMHPRFRWLTLAGAALVLAMGMTALFRARRGGFTGPVAFLLLLGIVLVGRPFSRNASSALMAPRVPDAQILEDPDFPLMEIMDLRAAVEEDRSSANGMAFSALGMIRRLPSPEADEQVALMRSYMACCAADALAFGFRMTGDDAKSLEDGDWVVVSGTLTQLSEPAPVSPFRMGTSTFSIVNEAFVVEPVRIVDYSATLPSLTDKLSSESITRFAEALRSAGLWKTLEGEGPFTVFAPMNEAFDDSAHGAFEEPLAPGDKMKLKNWLSRHIVAGRYLDRDLYDETTLRTIDDQDLHVHVVNGRLLLEDARLLFKNMVARNGVVHIIYPSLNEAP